jgi:MFS family permease
LIKADIIIKGRKRNINIVIYFISFHYYLLVFSHLKNKANFRENEKEIFLIKKIDKIKIILYGALCCSLGYFILLFDSWGFVLVISIVLLTFGEIFAFPFSNAVALDRAPKGQEGQYMGLFTMSFSLAHIACSKTGLDIIAHFGYTTNWIVMGSLGLVAVFCCLWLQRMIKAENIQAN